MKEASRILGVSVRRLQIWDKVSSPYRYPINRGNSSFLVFLSNFIDECRVVGLLLVNLWTSALAIIIWFKLLFTIMFHVNLLIFYMMGVSYWAVELLSFSLSLDF